jgi:transposase
MANLALEAGCSESTVRRWLVRFEEDGQITRRVTNRFTQINVINYSFYQDVPDEGGERVTERMTERVTDQMTEQMTPNRRSKEREEIKKERRERAAPTLDEVKQFVKEEGLTIDPARFFNFYESQDWKTSSGYTIKDWKSKARSWQSSERPKRKEELPDFYNPEPIRDTEPKLATPEEIARVRALLNKGRKT